MFSVIVWKSLVDIVAVQTRNRTGNSEVHIKKKRERERLWSLWKSVLVGALPAFH